MRSSDTIRRSRIWSLAIRPPYTVRGLGFDPQGNTWQAAVAELDAVRVAEGSNRRERANESLR